ncbi:MAG: hypothetical protein ACR2QC_08445 [Gammaproteobacteria bacterium]
MFPLIFRLNHPSHSCEAGISTPKAVIIQFPAALRRRRFLLSQEWDETGMGRSLSLISQEWHKGGNGTFLRDAGLGGVFYAGRIRIQ